MEMSTTEATCLYDQSCQSRTRVL